MCLASEFVDGFSIGFDVGYFLRVKPVNLWMVL